MRRIFSSTMYNRYTIALPIVIFFNTPSHSTGEQASGGNHPIFLITIPSVRKG